MPTPAASIYYARHSDKCSHLLYLKMPTPAASTYYARHSDKRSHLLFLKMPTPAASIYYYKDGPPLLPVYIILTKNLLAPLLNLRKQTKSFKICKDHILTFMMRYKVHGAYFMSSKGDGLSLH